MDTGGIIKLDLSTTLNLITSARMQGAPYVVIQASLRCGFVERNEKRKEFPETDRESKNRKTNGYGESLKQKQIRRDS